MGDVKKLNIDFVTFLNKVVEGGDGQSYVVTPHRRKVMNTYVCRLFFKHGIMAC